jgi:hypothetical protein
MEGKSEVTTRYTLSMGDDLLLALIRGKSKRLQLDGHVELVLDPLPGSDIEWQVYRQSVRSRSQKNP